MTRWFARQRYLIDFTLAALSRRRAKNIGLIIIYTLVVFVLASVMLFASAIRHEARQILAGSPEILVQNVLMGRHDLMPGDAIQKLASIRGVRSVQGRLWGYFYDTISDANYTIMVPGAKSGITLEPTEVAIGEGVARVRGFSEGGRLFFIAPNSRWFKARIVKVLEKDTALVSSDLVLMSEPDFRAFFDLPANVHTDIALSVRNQSEIDTIVAKAARELASARFITRDDVARTYESIFDWREGVLLALATGALLAFAIFSWEKASGLNAEEAREIGILKAVGWDTSDIMATKFWEGALVSLTAFLAGFGLAYVHVFSFSAPMLAPVLKGWSVLYPDFALVPHVDGLQMATLFIFSVVPFTAATLVPIWRAATRDPDEVMR